MRVGSHVLGESWSGRFPFWLGLGWGRRRGGGVYHFREDRSGRFGDVDTPASRREWVGDGDGEALLSIRDSQDLRLGWWCRQESLRGCRWGRDSRAEVRAQPKQAVSGAGGQFDCVFVIGRDVLTLLIDGFQHQ